VHGSLATSRCIGLGLRAQRAAGGGGVHQRGRVWGAGTAAGL